MSGAPNGRENFIPQGKKDARYPVIRALETGCRTTAEFDQIDSAAD
jgi:hypothetical protein